MTLVPSHLQGRFGGEPSSLAHPMPPAASGRTQLPEKKASASDGGKTNTPNEVEQFSSSSQLRISRAPLDSAQNWYPHFSSESDHVPPKHVRPPTSSQVSSLMALLTHDEIWGPAQAASLKKLTLQTLPLLDEPLSVGVALATITNNNTETELKVITSAMRIYSCFPRIGAQRAKSGKTKQLR
eukprot:CAMPEP_0176088454 /NCGR_PEP_ID=MMETSP0120_2-20121206/44289_1 /TAXON_ID=160619 /ORGANISM="Kryptoperidinium foliaceum, Strain CCMP 1326" /LENGTH=182 /DNA_ID=CAMNT_0017422311 /DNA_START=491 /DNA_END=1035 /DNA_ORIENTATION=-